MLEYDELQKPLYKYLSCTVLNLSDGMNLFISEIKFLLLLGKIWAIEIINARRETLLNKVLFDFCGADSLSFFAWNALSC